MSESFIRCESLVKIYKLSGVEVQALQGLDLSVGQGEMLGIVGASGSGKSTLMNILGGLDRPTAGNAHVGQYNLLKLSDRALTHYRRSMVGFVWQQAARNLVPYLTAVENVEMPMMLAGRRKTGERARQLLEMVGLADRRHHRLDQLSGGEQQRVAIAVALADEPELLLADEPTGELDNATAQTIFDVLRTINTSLGVTMLIVTHDPAIAQQVNRVVSVRDGKLAAETIRRAVETEDETGTHVSYQMLDSAGRMQIPKEYREHFQIKHRVILEPQEDGILIKPVSDESYEQRH
ncbi:MAG: ATP-binding cassette domain-containing protein [Anaerolineae bacterium]|nr:ATP-binding cassette domain-containing protein [Anaerolineae bacterium]